jgi:multiple sugar transport system permease protein
MNRPERSLAAWVLNLGLAGAAFVTAAPLLWMLSVSLMPVGEANSLPPRVLPSAPTLEHYREIFVHLDMGRYLKNSLILSGGTTLLSVLLCALAGYSFAKLRFGGRDRLFGSILLLLVVPAQVGMLPLFLILKQMGLVNTFAGAMIPGLASIASIFLIRQFAITLPDELLDAARIDGASESQIFFRIVLPLLTPILVTVGVLTFLTSWNDFLWPLIVLAGERNYTLPAALANLSGEHVQDTELMMAGSVLTILPGIVLFFALQRYYVEGVLMGSLKE